ncbi:MAG: MBL fold metallo-hydrolase [Rhodospirillales bacterium]|nr:MBL fold metallo-hydrolase [Rhodospirillales bacterium]
MRVHHLNCGSMCPVGGAGLGMPALGCHCLLIETGSGLVLVDTGFGLEDVERPRPRLSSFFIRLDRIRFDAMDTAVEQVRELGFKPADVRHIVLTHLDFDHAGGITDFPGATVHLLADEAAAARHRRGFIARRRYRPAQWRAAAKWQEYRPEGENWFGFSAVRQLQGLPPEILLVPLPGHSAGHCGVAVRSGSRWLFHAGDAYFDHAEMNPQHPRSPAGLAAYQWLMQTDAAARRQNQQRLRDLAARTREEVTIFCSHDLVELENRQRAAEHALRQAERMPAVGGAQRRGDAA